MQLNSHRSSMWELKLKQLRCLKPRILCISLKSKEERLKFKLKMLLKNTVATNKRTFIAQSRTCCIYYTLLEKLISWKIQPYNSCNGVAVRCVNRSFSASDLCSDGRVVRMWVRILAATTVLVSFSKTLYHNCFSPPRSKWVPVRAELVVVFD